MPSEHVVAGVDELGEGDHVVVEIEGRGIGVFNVGGRYFGLRNICPHQGGPLCRGPIGGTMLADEASGWQKYWAHEGEIVRCPWHGLEFNITTGECLANPRWRVATYHVHVVDDQVVVQVA